MATPASGLVIMITMAWPNVVSPHKILSFSPKSVLLKAALKFRVEEMYNDSHDENKGPAANNSQERSLTSRERILQSYKAS